MTLIERLRRLEADLATDEDGELIQAAIARIEAAEDAIEHGNAASHARYRALVREQDGGASERTLPE